MKKLLVLIIILAIAVAGCFYTYNYMISAQGNDGSEVSIYVNEGDTYSTIGSILKEKSIIRNELAYKIYVRLNKPTDLEFGEYSIKNNLSVEDVIKELKKGSNSKAETITVTFYEGKNMRNYVSKISESFNIDEKEIYNKLSDSNYLDTLIEKYWFITKDIKNKNIYYSLEGYLFPDTYEFYTSATIEDVFEKMLNNTEKKISSYKDKIEKSKYSFHQILTLASIIEQEAGNAKDRKGVAGVFYNRLADGWSLGSDVTTYYAEKIDNFSKDLTQADLSKCNSYNTRSSCMKGKLPVGPICNPGLESITAAISPKKHNYYYFVADKNGKTYFNKDDDGHSATVAKLKRDGLWIEYED